MLVEFSSQLTGRTVGSDVLQCETSVCPRKGRDRHPCEM